MQKETLKTLQHEFKNPGSLFRGAPFWAWNGKLEPDELRRQIRLMKEMGLGGFFMHSRVGLATPYLSNEWFDCIRVCCEEAEKLGMKAWLYDEDRWPSGAAGGLVTKDPKYRARSLVAPVHSLKLGDWAEQGLPFYSGAVSYLRKIQPTIPEGRRLFVRIPDYRGVAVRILIDGKEAGVRAWEPYEIDITDFVFGQKEVTLAIEVIGHRRNSHGPLHLSGKESLYFGHSAKYVTEEGKKWHEEYQLVSCGLMAAPELVVRTPV